MFRKVKDNVWRSWPMITIYVLVGIYLALVTIAPLADFRKPSGDIISEFKAIGQDVDIDFYRGPDRSIRYLSVGEGTETLIVFFHGSPGDGYLSSRHFLKNKDLLTTARMIAVDRPGYGESGFGKSEPSIERQAEAIAPIIAERRQHYDRILLIGFSYGGAVMAKLTMDYPHLVDGALFISSSLVPNQEHTFAASYLLDWYPFRWILPAAIRVANDEKLAHHEALEDIQEGWDRVTVPCMFMYSAKDKLIYSSNSLSAASSIDHAPTLLKELTGGIHSLGFAQPRVVQETIDEFLQWQAQQD